MKISDYLKYGAATVAVATVLALLAQAAVYYLLVVLAWLIFNT